jgi:hypothetical protein
MTAILLQLIRQVDDADGFEGAFFDAYAASAAQLLRNDYFVFFEAYGFDSAANHRAVFYAHLVAFFGLAFVVVHYGDAGHGSSSMKGKGRVINYNLQKEVSTKAKPPSG